MTAFAFGELKFNRKAIPSELRALETWPSIDQFALTDEDRDSFNSKCEALRLFIDSSTSISVIENLTGVPRATLYRLLPRCWAKHADGRIYGFRGLIPYARVNKYERTEPVKCGRTGRGGATGAFSQLLSTYPALADFLTKKVRERSQRIRKVGQIRTPIKSIHKDFLQLCRELGLGTNQYPFTEHLLASRTLASYIKKKTSEEFSDAVTLAGGLRAGAAVPIGVDQTPAATRAFESVEFDGHKIDLRLTVRIEDPQGFETLLEMHRIWVLVLIDVASRAIIGYSLALGREYNKDDVAKAFQNALVPFKHRAYRIPGLQIRKGGGFPSESCPETAYACWDWLRIDGAKSHLASDTLNRLTQVIGCWPDNGPAGEPDDRPFIERFFQNISLYFAHRLPGTTGSTANSIEKVLNDPGKDIKLLVELEELEDMIEVTLADYNGEPHGGLGGRTPLEAMTYLIQRHPGFLRTLPETLRANICLLQEARVVPIKGNLKIGVRPFVNFANVRYTNSVLASNALLIGKRLRIYYDVQDLRSIKAFFEDGTELGVLTAARPWCFTPHSLRLRTEIFRLKRARKLEYREGDDPVEAWAKFKLAQSKTNKNAVNALAKVKRQSIQEKQAEPARDVLTEPLLAEKKMNDKECENIEMQKIQKASGGELGVPKQLKVRRTITF
jgi:putative transposase